MTHLPETTAPKSRRKNSCPDGWLNAGAKVPIHLTVRQEEYCPQAGGRCSVTGRLWPSHEGLVKLARMIGEQHRQPPGVGNADCVLIPGKLACRARTAGPMGRSQIQTGAAIRSGFGEP